MGRIIDFEGGAVASLRRRVAEVEEANQDLIAFARGHSGAVSAIHGAILAAIDADSFDHLAHIVTHEWPDLLGLDAVAVAILEQRRAMRIDSSGLQLAEPRLVARLVAPVTRVELRDVDRGHPLFGPASELIRAEALIRLGSPAVPFTGLLALGQRRHQGFDTRHGSDLLHFLGATLSRIMARWLPA